MRPPTGRRPTGGLRDPVAGIREKLAACETCCHAGSSMHSQKNNLKMWPCQLACTRYSALKWVATRKGLFWLSAAGHELCTVNVLTFFLEGFPQLLP